MSGGASGAAPGGPGLQGIAPDKLPRHLAVIMDGNGRWAQQRGLVRTSGHDAGAKTIRTVTTECARLGLEQLTLYAFSHENWKRPKGAAKATSRVQ